MKPKKRGRSILLQTQPPGSPNKSNSSLASPQSIALSDHDPQSPARDKPFLKPPMSSQALRASKTFKEPLRPMNQPSATNMTFGSTKTDEKSSGEKDSSSKGPNPYEQLQEIQDMIFILSQYPDLYMNYRGQLNQGKAPYYRASEMGSIHDLKRHESRNSDKKNASDSIRGSNRSSSFPKHNRRSHPALTQKVMKVNKIDLVVEILKRINTFVSQHNQSLGFEIQYNPKKFENDLKFYREWFRLREERQKKKYDFFYGPFEDRRTRPIMAHIENSFKNKRRTAQRFDLSDLIPNGGEPQLNKNHSQPIYDRAFMSTDDYKKDLQNYFITYYCDDCDPRKASNTMEAYREMIQKFWGRITDLITGPDHEYVYLKKLVQRIKEFNPKRNDKVYLRRRAKMTGIGTATGLGLKRQQSSRFGDSQRLSTRIGMGTSSPTKTASSSSQTRVPIIRKSLSKFSPSMLFTKSLTNNGEKRLSRNSPVRKNLKRLSEVQSQEKSTSKMSPSLVSDSSEVKQSGKTPEEIIITKSFQEGDAAHSSPSSPINLNLQQDGKAMNQTQPSITFGGVSKNLALKEITESDNERESVQVDRRHTPSQASPNLDPSKRKSYMLIESHGENAMIKAQSPLSQELNEVASVSKNMFEFDELNNSSSQMPLSSKSNQKKRLLNNTISSSRSRSKTVQSKKSQLQVTSIVDKKSSDRPKTKPRNSDLFLVTGESERDSKECKKKVKIPSYKLQKKQKPSRKASQEEAVEQQVPADPRRNRIDFYSQQNITKSKSRQRRTHYFQRGFHPMSDHFQTLLNKPQYQFGDKQSMALLNKSFETAHNFNREVLQELENNEQAHSGMPTHGHPPCQQSSQAVSRQFQNEDDDVVQFKHPNLDLEDIVQLPIQEEDRDSCSTIVQNPRHPGRILHNTRPMVSHSQETHPTLPGKAEAGITGPKKISGARLSYLSGTDQPMVGPMPYSSHATSLHSKSQSQKKDMGYYIKQYSKKVREASGGGRQPKRHLKIRAKGYAKQQPIEVDSASISPTNEHGAAIFSNSEHSQVGSPPGATDKIMRFLNRPESFQSRPQKPTSISQTIKSPEATNETTHDIEKLQIFLDANMSSSAHTRQRAGVKTHVQVSHQRLPAMASPETDLFAEPSNDLSPYASRRLKSVSQLQAGQRSGLQHEGSNQALKQKLSYASITQMAAAVEKVLSTSKDKPQMQTLKPRVRPWTGNATRAQRSLGGQNRESQTLKAGEPVFKIFHKSSNSNSQLNRQSTQITTIGGVRDRNRKLTSSIGALSHKIKGSSTVKTRNPRGSEVVFSKLIDEVGSSPIKRSQVYQPNFFTINAQLPEEDMRPSRVIPRTAAIKKQLEISRKFKEYFSVSSKPKGVAPKEKKEEAGFDFLDHYIEMRLNGVTKDDAVSLSRQQANQNPPSQAPSALTGGLGAMSHVAGAISDVESKKSRTLNQSEFLQRISIQQQEQPALPLQISQPPRYQMQTVEHRSDIQPKKEMQTLEPTQPRPLEETSKEGSISPSKKFSTRLDLSFIHRQRRDPSKKKPWR